MRVSLALGGGGARGLAHIHVLEALDDLGVRPVEIAGSSIGALMGTAYASGMSGRDVRDYTLSVWSRPREVLGAIWRMRQSGGATGDFRQVPLLKPRMTDLDAERTLRAFMPTSWPQRIEELGIPMAITVTDFYDQFGFAVRSGPLIEWLAAGIAIPAVFCPRQLDDRVLIDGGIANPVPFDVLGEAVEPADIVLAVDVIGKPVRRHHRLPNKREQLFGASQIMMRNAIREKAARLNVDILIHAPVDGVGVLDFPHARSILHRTAATGEMVKRELGAALERAEAA